MIWPFNKKENRAENTTLECAFLGSAAVSRNTALEIPAVHACIERLSGDVSRLPIRLYKRDGDEVCEVENDIRTRLLNDDPRDALNANEFWKAMLEDYFLGNGARAYIAWDGLSVRSLNYVDCQKTSIQNGVDPIFKDYKILVEGQKFYPYQFLKLLRKTKNGSESTPLTDENPLIFSVAYNNLKFENGLVSRGGNKKGFLQAERHINNAEQLRKDFNRLYSNNDTSVVVLNDGVKFQESANTSVEMQLNENKRSNAEQICMLFGVPPAIIFGGATQQDRDMYADTVMNLLTTIETALDRDLLLETEKGAMYFAYDTRELNRGNMKERFEAYKTALDSNIMQLDEVRKREDLKPLGFNKLKMGLADVFYDPATGEVYTPNTNASANIKGGDTNAN